VVPASPAIPPAASASPVMPFAGDGLDPYFGFGSGSGSGY
jgi:hypothetical protein